MNVFGRRTCMVGCRCHAVTRALDGAWDILFRLFCLQKTKEKKPAFANRERRPRSVALDAYSPEGACAR
jgi:hypothetical protein